MCHPVEYFTYSRKHDRLGSACACIFLLVLTLNYELFSTVGVWPGNVNAVRFLLNGENINPESTTEDMNLDEENHIRCELTSNLIVDEPLTICVKFRGEETMFRIKRTTTMNKVFAAFASRIGMEVTSREYCTFLVLCRYSSLGIRTISKNELIAEWITHIM